MKTKLHAHLVLAFCLALFQVPQALAVAPSCQEAVAPKGVSPYKLSLALDKSRVQGAPKLKLMEGGTALSNSINALFRLIHKPLKVDEVAAAIKRFENDPRDLPYFTKLLEAARIQIVFNEKMLEQIPKTGGLAIFGNHPKFGIEGLAIAAAIEKVRPDLKIMMNQMLQGVPELPNHAVLVDPFGGKSAVQFNRSKILEANEHVQNGGALLVFSSGAPTQKFKNDDFVATDQVWRKGSAHFARQGSDTQIVTIFTEGEPSKAYLNAKLYAPPLALLIGVREIGSQTGTTIRFEIGRPISAQSIRDLTNEDMLVYLRGKTYLLGSRMIEEMKSAQSREAYVKPAVKTELQNGKLVVRIPVSAMLSQAEADMVHRVHPTLAEFLPLLSSHDHQTQDLISQYAAQGAEFLGLQSRASDQLVEVLLTLSPEVVK